MIFTGIVTLSLLATVWFTIFFLIVRHKFTSQKQNREDSKLKVGLFHPYCNAGGGGEKVLWVALRALQERYPDAEYYIYTVNIEATPQEILAKVDKVLNVKIENSVKFIYLNRKKWIEAQTYPYFTLLGQSLGSVYLGLEALSQLNPGTFHYF